MSEGKHRPRRPPKVVVAPECVSGVRDEEERREYLSVKGWIERYLKDPGVLRKPDEIPWPSREDYARWSRSDTHELNRWSTLHHQYEIDGYLRCILHSKDLRKALNPEPAPSHRPGNIPRDWAMLCEVLRLTEQGHKRSDAAKAVAAEYGVSLRTLQDVIKENRPADEETRRRVVEVWTLNLRTAGKLK